MWDRALNDGLFADIWDIVIATITALDDEARETLGIEKGDSMNDILKKFQLTRATLHRCVYFSLSIKPSPASEKVNKFKVKVNRSF